MSDGLEPLRAALSDRYRLDRELGQGGMATVYLATDLRHQRSVALKVLRPELAAVLGGERFLREIRVTATLQHPHILPLFDSGEAAGLLFYVMPYVEGESLRERLQREGQLPLDEALALTRQVASALDYAHQQGVVHRDIKPENVLLHRGEAVVADFGIALAVSVAGGERVTETGLSLGTPAYMSPEQAAGSRAVDARSDVYSLGAVLYEMLVGEPPHTGPTVQAVVAKLLAAEPVAPRTLRRTVPEHVDSAVLKALAKLPADRFGSAAEFAAALTADGRRLTAQKSIVVLPFENLSPDPDNAFFADGLTEELIADLSKVRALRVISRTSAMHFKGTTQPLPAIAQELNVRYVLEGSVRRAGNSLRITAQLIDAASDVHLWAEKYAGTLEDVFDLQERLSRRIVEALKGTLTPDDERRLASHGTSDPRVYDVWLRARQESGRLTREGVEAAIRLTNQALATFGDHALLHAADGINHYFAYDFGFSHDEETLRKVEAAAARALELSPDLPQAWLAKGLSGYKHGDMAGFVRHLRRAVELERSSDALAWLAFVLAEAGCVAEARGFGEEAVERDPLSLMPQLGRSVVDLFDGRFEAALVGMREWGGSGMTDVAFAQWWLGQALAYAGKEPEAIAAYERGAGAGSGVMADICELGVRALRGDRDAALSWLEARESIRQGAMSDETFPRYLSECMARVGEQEAALRWLEQAIAWGFTNHRFLSEHDCLLAPLRGDPRFEALVDRARTKQQEIEAAL